VARAKTLGANVHLSRMKKATYVLLGITLPINIVVAILTALGIEARIANIILYAMIFLLLVGLFIMSVWILIMVRGWIREQLASAKLSADPSWQLFNNINYKTNIVIATLVVMVCIVIGALLEAILGIETPLKFIGTFSTFCTLPLQPRLIPPY
jgi:hypothetical protein